MKKDIFSILCGLLLISFVAAGQKPAVTEVRDDSRSANVPTKSNAITEDKSTFVEITGIGAVTFFTSSHYDGKSDDGKKSLRIILALQTSTANKDMFQLVFHSDQERIYYVTSSNSGNTSIYYPISLYDAIKSKLEQALASKKKVQLKVIETKDGYREGTLML